MSVNDYVKFITQTFVQHYEKPSNERKSLKHKRKSERPPFMLRWFGILPYAFMVLFKKNK
ncbi:YqzE family protein [Rossellomorea aquimaris]|nr:YqzE family protein [Rossellomorea aquimaris]